MDENLSTQIWILDNFEVRISIDVHTHVGVHWEKLLFGQLVPKIVQRCLINTFLFWGVSLYLFIKGVPEEKEEVIYGSWTETFPVDKETKEEEGEANPRSKVTWGTGHLVK